MITDARPDKKPTAWVDGASALLLGATVLGLAAGLTARAAGQPTWGEVAWAGATLAALVPALVSAVRDVLRGHAGVDVIAILAMAGSLVLGEYLAGAVIAVMMATGGALESFAAARARRDLSALVQRAPRSAWRYEAGVLANVAVEHVGPGDRLLVRPGDVIPVDGVLAGGSAVLDESALTGESRPVAKLPGDRLSSGTVNAGPAFDMRCTAGASESTYAGILHLVEEAQAGKAPFVRLADRYALLFVPLALAVASVAWGISGDPVRALAVLVVATPCPLLLAVPIAIVAGISRAARHGIIVKGGAALEALARARILLLDKTGTLTHGGPRLVGVTRFAGGSGIGGSGGIGGIGEDELLRLVASVEQVSPHVLSAALVQAARERGLELAFPEDVREVAGSGIAGRVGGRLVAVGTAEWVSSGAVVPEEVRTFRRREALTGALLAFAAVDGVIVGALALDDPLRPDAPRTIRSLRQAGIDKVIMVTGDHPLVAESVGAAVGVDRVLAERSPADKVDAVREARAEGTTLMVGDGINDAPALAAAHVGVALGARGISSSSAAADIVLVVDRLDRLVEGLRIARHSRSVAVQSVLFGMGLSLVAMAFAAAGYLPPVTGALVQEGIDIIAIANALRALGRGARSAQRAVLPPELSRRLKEEHQELIPALQQVRAVADGLGGRSPEHTLSELQRLDRFLTDEVLPHERQDETEVYPTLARRLGGDDPLASMSRAHREIFHLARLYKRLVEDVSPAGPSSGDLTELRRVLYSLHAVLRLHFAQEEELYLSLDGDYLGEAAVQGAAAPDSGAPG